MSGRRLLPPLRKVRGWQLATRLERLRLEIHNCVPTERLENDKRVGIVFSTTEERVVINSMQQQSLEMPSVGPGHGTGRSESEPTRSDLSLGEIYLSVKM
jgi:hypothetical protein